MPSHSPDLPNSQSPGPVGAPLVEAVFELRWELPAGAKGRGRRDPGYEFLLGRFLDRVGPQYPRVANLPSASLPIEQTPYTPRHHFRSEGQRWPMLQLGPGILFANEGRAYRWSAFRPRVAAAVESLFDCYPVDPFPLTPVMTGLRYINTLPLDPDERKLPALIREKLHTSLSLDPALFDDPMDVENPCGLDFKMTFPMSEPAGFGTISISTGLDGGAPCLIWQLEARAMGRATPPDRRAVEDWIDGAHAMLLRWFRTLGRGEILASLEAGS